MIGTLFFGGNMSVETLKKIRKAEEDAAGKVKAAQADAERARKRAEKAAASLVEGARKDAEEKAASLKAQRIEEGKAEADRILAASAKELQRMKLAAEKNLETAVELVVQRVCG